MIRRNTWIALLVFVVLAGVAYGLTTYKNHRAKAQPTPLPTPNDIITFTSDDILEVTIRSADQTLILRRATPKAAWEVVQPEPQGNEFPDQERINTAVFNITALSALTTVPAGTDLTTLGLLEPTYTLTIRLKDGKTWRAEIGKETPIGSGYYVRANGQLFVADKYAIDNIAQILQHPPLATPMPTNTPTPVATATLTAAPPTPTPTPTP